ncbi:DUF563 domain-containing protein [Duganella sp. FT92W]|uniref:DUF563 domain-containing protein n=1 Tax=Pseudoduganella rivuli TaxID=2666085 RepID=A0A7X2LRN2_9BURK|nr:glycosyltransferase family 61 protein [Pseudoduganella rivuli]MRV71401.1 DUF563 domain-containing protein [Pseudoduganella rivuli]
MLKNLFSAASYSESEKASITKILSFDEKEYLDKYPDVAEAGVNALDHFLELGMHEGRFPWSLADERESSVTNNNRTFTFAELIGFDSTFYSAKYPDVPSNQLHHFFRHGMAETRQPFNFHDNLVSEGLTWKAIENAGLEIERSLDQQLFIEIEQASGLINELLDVATNKRTHPKTYRNNFWLALAIGFLSRKEYGAATLCYNYFFNYFLPMPLLGNYSNGIYIAGKRRTLAEYTKQNAIPTRQLATARTVTVNDPVFLNRKNPPATPEVHELPRPIYTVLQDVNVIGGNSIIIAGPHDFIYDYIDADTERQSEFKGPSLLHVSNDSCSIKYCPTDIYVQEAFSLLHDHGHNYFHWMIEVLPRYLLARRNGLAKDVTLLIDEQIGRLQEDVLLQVAGKDVKLVKVPRNSSIRVGRLHCVTDLSVNTVHTLDLPLKSDILISPTAIELLREVGQPFNVSGISKFEKLHIVRHNVEFRRLSNRNVMRTMLANNGYWGFDPGSATFENQVRVFSNAKIVIAEAGAALANMVFCQPNSTICVLVNGYKNSNYYYIVEMADALGINLVFFECLRLVGTHALGVHDDMLVHVGLLEEKLAEIMAEKTRQADTAIGHLKAVAVSDTRKKTKKNNLSQKKVITLPVAIK